MRNSTTDLTLERNYIEKYRFLIKEYELVKLKKHPQFKFAKDFYVAHSTNPKSFLKYYNRYKQYGKKSDLLQKTPTLNHVSPCHILQLGLVSFDI